MVSLSVQNQSPYVTIGGQRVGVWSAGKRQAVANVPKRDHAIHLAFTTPWQRLCPELRAHKGWLIGGLGVLGLALGLVLVLSLRTVQRT
jgi:hypothetical protein